MLYYTSGYDGYVQFYNGATCGSSPAGAAIPATGGAAGACDAKAKAVRDAESSDPCYSYSSSLSTLACPTGYSGSPTIYYTVCNFTTGVPSAGGTTCRASKGTCDPAEKCSGTSTTCPGDVLSSSATVCRSAAGTCDVAEYCTGASAACPGDARVPAGTVCRAGQGACNPAEYCNGTSASCPSDVHYSGTDCNGQCVSTSSDPSNCGVCGRSCGGSQCCSGACVDTQGNDSNNCGSCGHACEASCSGNRSCTAGHCPSLSTYDFTVAMADTRCMAANPSVRATSSAEAYQCVTPAWGSSQYVLYPVRYSSFGFCAHCWVNGQESKEPFGPLAANAADALTCARSTFPGCQIETGSCQ